MGRTVTADVSVGLLKQDHVLATTAAASVATARDQVVIFVGSNLAGRSVEVVNAIKRCFYTLSRLGNPTPAANQVAYARFTDFEFGAADILTSTSTGTEPTLTEDDVYVAYGDLFQEYEGQGIGGIALKALENYKEAYAKKGL